MLVGVLGVVTGGSGELVVGVEVKVVMIGVGVVGVVMEVVWVEEEVVEVGKGVVGVEVEIVGELCRRCSHTNSSHI